MHIGWGCEKWGLPSCSAQLPKKPQTKKPTLCKENVGGQDAMNRFNHSLEVTLKSNSFSHKSNHLEQLQVYGCESFRMSEWSSCLSSDPFPHTEVQGDDIIHLCLHPALRTICYTRSEEPVIPEQCKRVGFAHWRVQPGRNLDVGRRKHVLILILWDKVGEGGRGAGLGNGFSAMQNTVMELHLGLPVHSAEQTWTGLAQHVRKVGQA